MKNKQNLHIHTTYTDGKNTPTQIVQAAIARGFDSIGFSEHTYNRYSRSIHQMTVSDMETYKTEIRALKETYRGIIDIFCGLELEHYSDVPTEGYDYLIGSLHYLNVSGDILGFDRGLEETRQYIENNFGGNGLAFAKQYFESLVCLPEKNKLDILGHFDIITKNNEKGHFWDPSEKEYLDSGREAIHALRGKIPLFEVNTGAIARGYRTEPYPQMEFLREFCRCGFGAVISSDCHNREFIDCFYEEAEQLLRAAGFRSKWILTGDGFREVAL